VKVMLPNTLFFEAAAKVLDEAVLLSCIGLNELLAQTVNHGRRHETAGFEKSVHCRYARPASDPEDAGCRSAPGRPPERAFNFVGAAAQGES
jgi:hypothetical protein